MIADHFTRLFSNANSIQTWNLDCLQKESHWSQQKSSRERVIAWKSQYCLPRCQIVSSEQQRLIGLLLHQTICISEGRSVLIMHEFARASGYVQGQHLLHDYVIHWVILNKLCLFILSLRVRISLQGHYITSFRFMFFGILGVVWLPVTATVLFKHPVRVKKYASVRKVRHAVAALGPTQQHCGKIRKRLSREPDLLTETRLHDIPFPSNWLIPTRWRPGLCLHRRCLNGSFEKRVYWV